MASLEHFVLARESPAKGGKTFLPGIPVALVKSDNPSLAGAFLCAVAPEGSGRTSKEDAAADAALVKAARQARDDLKYASGKDGSAIRALHRGAAAKPPTRLEGGRESHFGGPDPFAALKRRQARYGDRTDPLYEAAHSGRWQGEPDPKEEQAEDSEDDPDEEERAGTDGGPPRTKLPPEPPSALLALKESTYVKLPPNSWFEPLPLIKPADREAKDAYRTTMYVAGRSGCGKSFWSAGVLRRYKKLWPDNPLWGVCKTRLADDPAYAGLPIQQLPLTKLKEFAAKQKERAAREGGSAGGASGEIIDVRGAFGSNGCFILFDDWDSFEKEDKALVLAMIKDVQNLGRKLRISIIITSHLLTNYNETRGIISEAEYITVFPGATMPQQLNYLCQKLGVAKDMISQLRRKGRWVTIHNAAPLFILSEGECELLAPPEAGDVGEMPEKDPLWSAAGNEHKKRKRKSRSEFEEEDGGEDEAEYVPPTRVRDRGQIRPERRGGGPGGQTGTSFFSG